jgi:proteic killer suppression protein
MIKSFQHKGLKVFFETGSMAGIQANHAPRLRAQLGRLNFASAPQDMDLPGWHLHQLTGKLSGHFAVWVSGKWRLTFTFKNNDAQLVNYVNYH